MEIIIADFAGFCFGVKRAIKMAEENATGGKLVCLGPLIHNQQEMLRLSDLGVKTREQSDLRKAAESTAMIRTHGVGPAVYTALEQGGWEILDATCPYVHTAQKMAEKAVQEGYQPVILGDLNHVEVQGLLAWTGERAIVVKTAEELDGQVLSDKIAVLAQTTEKEEHFAKLVAYLEERTPELKVFSTICRATRDRQKAAAALAGKVEVMLIIGGRHSSNTQKLYEVSRTANKNSYLIEEASELNQRWFKDINKIGITAGASTPEWIIKEVIKKLEEIMDKKTIDEVSEAVVTNEVSEAVEASEVSEAVEANEASEAVEANEATDAVEASEASEAVEASEATDAAEDTDYEKQLDIVCNKPGDLIKGRAVQVTAEAVMVDIGGKSEAILPATEISHRNADPREMITVGQELLVEFIKEDDEGNIILSHKKALANQAYEQLTAALENGSIINAQVIEVVKGGLLVDVGIRGFLPASQVSRSYVEDLNVYLNLELRLKVLELDKEKNRVVLSHRAVLEEEEQQRKASTLAELTEGELRKGIVRRLAKFGAFIDIGGIDGLLHVSEMSWGRVEDPSEIVKEGDEIEVIVRKIDREAEKISLSLKALQKSPWDIGIEKYKANMVVNGKVTRIATFGAFIEIEPGIEGLAHISQISEKRISKVEEALNVGQEIQAKILTIDMDRKRIGLSLKDIVTDRERADVTTYIRKQTADDGATIGELFKIQQEKEGNK